MRMIMARHTSKEDAAAVSLRSQPTQTSRAVQSGHAPASLLSLQRTHGNQYVQRMLQRKCGCGSGAHGAEPLVQPKLSISQPGDAYEQEADAVAREIVEKQNSSRSSGDERRNAGATPLSVQRMIQRLETSNPTEMEEELRKTRDIQRKGEGEATATTGLDQRLESLAGGGHPLPLSVQQRMENSFGVSFDRVRIHTDGEAAQLSRSLRAEAFTYGNDIYFGSNKFDPSSRSGTELLAHELTHTLQQSGIQRKSLQRRGGVTVGTLAIRTNVVGAGLTDGHAWLSYTPNGGPQTTYGTWGNLTPTGLYRDRELTYHVAASRSTALDAVDHTALTTFAAANNSWGYLNNCSSFAARGWQAVTGEALAHTTWGIPNPSALGTGIVAAGGVLAVGPAPAPAGGSSSF